MPIAVVAVVGLLVIAVVAVGVLAGVAGTGNGRNRRRTGQTDLPEVTRLYQPARLVSAAERSFMGVVDSILPDGLRLFTKVRLLDVIEPRLGIGKVYYRARNRVMSKHVDFVVVRADTLDPVCCIELDDASHDRHDRKSRDDIVDDVFRDAELPLLHFPAQRAYDPRQIIQRLQDAIPGLSTIDSAAGTDRRSPTEIPLACEPVRSAADTNLCPKCGAPLVLRTAKRGQDAGKQFWGCSRYPACKAILEA